MQWSDSIRQVLGHSRTYGGIITRPIGSARNERYRILTPAVEIGLVRIAPDPYIHPTAAYWKGTH